MGTTTLVERDTGVRRRGAALAAALLSLAVAAIHLVDQGGVPGSKDPHYVALAYYALEVGAVVAACMLLARLGPAAWWLALAVGAGPLIGYALSRGPGLPNYTDDRGNWTEPIGLLSLAVEALLVLIALSMVRKDQPAVEA